nr:PAS domain-containing protein [Actinomycetota bacterium]
ELASEWGVDTLPDGKTVWFRLRDGPHGDQAHHFHGDQAHPTDSADVAGPAAETSGAGKLVTVQLLEAPVLLLQAWQQHGQTLLREYLFATLDLGDEALETHAHANDALAWLSDHLPGPDLDDVGAMVVQDGDSRPRTVVVRLPANSVAHFTVLCDALAAAQQLADRGLLLNHPSQPELHQLGRWLCDQVDVQTAGGPPKPWAMQVGRPPPAGVPLEWDASIVTRATEPEVAADDTNQVIAVSPAALDLLGYEDEHELVGGRLLQIIPSRFHEAHLTGFTLHFLTGRNTLLGQPITVPARRWDGTETTVELLLQAHTAPHGRKVFVARLRPL